MLCEVAHERQLAEVDFILVTEMTQRLAMVLESSADAPPQSGRKTGQDFTQQPQSIYKLLNYYNISCKHDSSKIS